MTRTRRLALLSLGAVLLLLVGLWLLRPASPRGGSPPVAPDAAGSSVSSSSTLPPTAASSATTVYAHNLRLRKGNQFRIYIRWVRGQMLRTRAGENPSFDDPDSFVFRLDEGVIHANLGDIGNFLNSAVPASFPLKNVVVVGDDEQVRLTGTVHKLLLPLPVELQSTVSATADGRIHLHITKINVLKIPLKALLGGLHVEIDDIMGKTPIAGVEVSGNDLFFDTTRLLPPPHIRGHLTSVRVARPDLVLIYGNAPTDETALAQWHNFLRLAGGTVDFGKLSMHPTDLTLIDASNSAWFDLDLVNYQAQLVNGYSRMTPQAGLEIFMPSLDDKVPQKAATPAVTLEWLRNRNTSLPADVPAQARR